MLDERLFTTPSVAVDRSKAVTEKMAEIAASSIKDSFSLLDSFDSTLCDRIIQDENKVDKYEDKLGTYLVKVSSLDLTDKDSTQVTQLLHIINDFERISDHAVNIVQSAEEINDKKLEFSGAAKNELLVMINAVTEIVDLAYDSFVNQNLGSAKLVEPLEEVIDELRDGIKSRHINRLQKGECTIELGFILSDLLTNLERIADHCSNVAGCVLEISMGDLSIHKYLREIKEGNKEEFEKLFAEYSAKYSI